MPRPCDLDPNLCRTPGATHGHLLTDQRREAAHRRWWGWRDAVVTRQGTNGWLDLGYLQPERRVRVWHHVQLALEEREVVWLHEELGVLAGPFGMVSVDVIFGGLGAIAVPDPRSGRQDPLDAGIEPCCLDPLDDRCTSGMAGHGMTFGRARRTWEHPWGWRTGSVVHVSADGWLDVRYAEDAGTARLWHHADLTDRLQPGDAVEVHEQYAGLRWSDGRITAAVAVGAGPVPSPPEARQMPAGSRPATRSRSQPLRRGGSPT